MRGISYASHPTSSFSTVNLVQPFHCLLLLRTYDGLNLDEPNSGRYRIAYFVSVGVTEC
jgi:hypothetical protein